MKLFSKKKKKQAIQDLHTHTQEYDEIDVKVEKQKVDFRKIEERSRYVNDLCEKIKETNKFYDEYKSDYSKVTLLLSDIQMIEQIPTENKEVLVNTAANIIALSKERQTIQNKTTKISQQQIKVFEPYESTIPSEISKMKEQENYQLLVKNDLRQLNGEKAAFFYEKGELVKKQKTLKTVAMFVCVLAISLIVLLTILGYGLKQDIVLLFATIAAIVVAVEGVIFFKSRKNHKEMAILETKQSRLVGLLNKVKIKYVNCTNILNYLSDKYKVKNSVEFEFFWKEYCKLKEEWKRHQKTTKLLNEYNTVLLYELRKYQMKEPEIWFTQAAALVDDKEMVEIRHALNERRQTLRKKLEESNQIVEACQKELQDIAEKNSDWAREVLETVKTYQI